MVGIMYFNYESCPDRQDSQTAAAQTSLTLSETNVPLTGNGILFPIHLANILSKSQG